MSTPRDVAKPSRLPPTDQRTAEDNTARRPVEDAVRRLATSLGTLGLVVMMIAILAAQTSQWIWIHSVGMVGAGMLAAVVVVQAWRLSKEFAP